MRILLHFNSNKFFKSAKSYILTNISCSILNLLVNIILYKSFELSYYIFFALDSITSSINVTITGLNDVNKLKILIEEISNIINNSGKLFDKLSKTQPIGRMGQPQEIADLALFLCSKEAAFITGTDFPIDGGFIKLQG